MKKLKYYALCSYGIAATKRHLKRIPKENLVIVINTWDEPYLQEAVAWCKENQIEYYVTQSDGTPATGKNSVFDLFLQSDNDYMVLVDGDDFITPHGLVVYNMIVQSENPPDAVALSYQYGIVPNQGYTWSLSYMNRDRSAWTHAADPYDQECIHGFGYRCFQRSKQWWDRALSGNLVEHWDDFTKQLSDKHQELMQFEYKYINQWETHCRIVLYSRNAAQYRFDKDLMVGEDTLQFFQLKDAMVKTGLNLHFLHEIYPTYVYDQRIGGTVQWYNETNAGHGWLEWMTGCVEKFTAYENQGKMHEIQIPWVDFLDFHVDYKPNTLGLVNFPARKIRY